MLAELTEEETAEQEAAYERLLAWTAELGIRKLRLPRKQKSCHCMADSLEALVITPEGKIGCCEHYSDTHLVGSIFEKADHWNRSEWHLSGKQYDSCENCVLYPDSRRRSSAKVFRNRAREQNGI